MNEDKLKTFQEWLYYNEEHQSDLIYLRQPIKDVWYDLTWKETMLRARKVTTFLKSLGLKKGDKVCIFSKNCAEWFITDFAIAMGGFISVPLFSTQHRDNIRYVLEHSESKAIFVGKLDDWTEQEKGIPENVIRIDFPYDNSMPAQYHWNDILRDYKPDMGNFIPDLDDLYTIVYTSGTTGNPKGAMITYRAQANVPILTRDTEKSFPREKVPEHFNLISYLPLGHITERMLIEYLSTVRKTTVSFSESLEKFPQNLRDISPNWFVAVPRLWTQFQKAILAKIPQRKLNILLKIPILNRIIRNKIKAQMGFSKTVVFASGSAPLSAELIKWYANLDIEIQEGYGRTEDLAMVSRPIPGVQRLGTVGLPMVGVEVKISDEGEVLTKSAAMMTGYYKNPEATAAVFTSDGFLHSGDRGTLDSEGYLIILGRLTDSFKTDKGEFVNPTPIEGKFLGNEFIEQACLIGYTLPQPVLLVVLSDKAKQTDRVFVKQELRQLLKSVNPDLTKFEKISHMIVLKSGWSPENNFLTPTLKLRRAVIHDYYIELARKQKDSKEPVVWEE